jgi:eukaryotic-like serine/threonine-protein kinase
MARDDDKKTKLGVVAPAPPRASSTGRGKARADLLGQTVAGYRLEAELGAGAMGTVYRARHVQVGRDVAVKVMHPHHVHNKVMLERFRREAKLAGRLRHPNVVCVIDVAEAPGKRMLIVFELAAGQSLTDIMVGPVPRPRVIALMRQLLLGLDHAHGVGLIHRDLKPDNVIVGTAPDGSDIPRIVDFGIAALRDRDESPDGVRLTASGEMIGTPMYMAPEQARCEPFDHRVDLFALGVILYEMLSGTVPFEGSAIEIALANANKDPPLMVNRAPEVEVDPLLELFARKLMARQVGQRLASAVDALNLLELIDRDRKAAGLSLGVTDTATASGVIALPPPPRRR